MFLDDAVIRRLVTGPWRHRHKFQWRQLRGVAWCVGQHRDGRWWVASAPSVTKAKTFCRPKFATEQEAKTAAVVAALLTATP